MCRRGNSSSRKRRAHRALHHLLLVAVPASERDKPGLHREGSRDLRSRCPGGRDDRRSARSRSRHRQRPGFSEHRGRHSPEDRCRGDRHLRRVTIVQGLDGDGERVRPTPNSNVLIELGYAMRSLGTTERLVLVMNTAYGGIDKLPFDLRQYRPTTYHLPGEATNDDRTVQRKALASKLEATFRHVLLKTGRRRTPTRNVTI